MYDRIRHGKKFVLSAGREFQTILLFPHTLPLQWVANKQSKFPDFIPKFVHKGHHSGKIHCHVRANKNALACCAFLLYMSAGFGWDTVNFLHSSYYEAVLLQK